MKRGLAGLIAVLLVSGFVAVSTVPANESVAPAASSAGSPATGSSADGHDHVHVDSRSSGARTTGTVSAAPSPALGPMRTEEGVEVLADGGPCGSGAVAIRVPLRSGIGCTHATLDLGTSHAYSTSIQPVDPVCFGNGVNGNRVHAIYAYPAGSPNRADEMVPQIKDVWVRRVEGNVRINSAEAGREIGVRWFMPGCELEVTTVELPASTADWEAGEAKQFGRIIGGLAAQGFHSDSRKYLVWFDGFAKHACGIATVVPFDDTPLPTNSHNGVTPGGLLFSPNVAVSYFKTNGGHSSSCWGSGSSGARVETHELFHTLGAVFTSAPNSDKAGHCIDGDDILCYGDGAAPRPLIRRCFGPVEPLDCNRDDYFNPRPPVGSYLSTHWNTANSSFLASAPVDFVPVAVPAP